MKNFYIIENDKVLVGTGLDVPDGAIEYKVGEEPKDLLEALIYDKEVQRVQEINKYTKQFIFKKYPIEKQSSANLGVYDEAYKNEMVTFIKRVVDLSNEAIINGTSFEDYSIILESE